MRRERAFSACYSLTSIEIPSSVTTIGMSAFYGCWLTSVEIPSSVTSIGDDAFEYCDNLTSITWDGNVYTSYSDFEKAFDKAHPSDD